MRRRKPVVAGADGAEFPPRLAVFDPSQWKGKNLFLREQAWKRERAAWVREFEPTGLDQFLEATLAPDEPLDPYSV